MESRVVQTGRATSYPYGITQAKQRKNFFIQIMAQKCMSTDHICTQTPERNLPQRAPNLPLHNNVPSWSGTADKYRGSQCRWNCATFFHVQPIKGADLKIGELAIYGSRALWVSSARTGWLFHVHLTWEPKVLSSYGVAAILGNYLMRSPMGWRAFRTVTIQYSSHR